MVSTQHPSSANQTGFTYMGVLFAVALLGTSLALIGSVWKTSQQRENEQELLFIGDQFRRAITLYYERTPSIVKQYPKSFDQLIKDDRYIVPQRYLRKVYRDPITNERNWGIVRAPDGGIMGVYSLSNKMPRKQSHFQEKYEGFSNAKQYTDWQFVYKPYIPTTITNATQKSQNKSRWLHM
jgi:type II secretory pathway pseudopilin PulG